MGQGLFEYFLIETVRIVQARGALAQGPESGSIRQGRHMEVSSAMFQVTGVMVDVTGTNRHGALSFQSFAWLAEHEVFKSCPARGM